MTVSHAIRLAWSLASQEAIRSRSDGIASEHFLEALLKLSELTDAELKAVLPDADAMPDVVAENHALRAAIARHGMDATTVRRTLRALVGKGTTPPGERQIHRTPDARNLFVAAARRAAASGRQTINLTDLLETILASPTERMVRAAHTRPPPAEPSSGRPTDNRSLPIIQPCNPSDDGSPHGRRAEVKAIARALAARNPLGVFVICDKPEVLDQMLSHVAAAQTQDHDGAEPSDRRIVDMRSLALSGEQAAKHIKRIRKIATQLADASTRPVFYLPAPDGASLKIQAAWRQLVKQLLTQDRIRCLCQLTHEAYDALVRDDAVWRDIAAPIRLQPDAPADIPAEL